MYPLHLFLCYLHCIDLIYPSTFYYLRYINIYYIKIFYFSSFSPSLYASCLTIPCLSLLSTLKFISTGSKQPEVNLFLNSFCPFLSEPSLLSITLPGFRPRRHTHRFVVILPPSVLFVLVHYSSFSIPFPIWYLLKPLVTLVEPKMTLPLPPGYGGRQTDLGEKRVRVG